MMLRRDGSPWLAFALVLAAGAACAALVALGNPGNMGVCGACFLRDASGALGFFSSKGPKIFRPELMGVVAGALVLALARRNFVARSGSYAAARFGLGVFMAIGALVFLGCPFRMMQRIGGGDVSAMIGLLGFVPGVGVAVWFEKRGYSIGRTTPAPAALGAIGPAFFVGLTALFLGGVLVGPGPGVGGPPAHAPWLQSLGIATAVGAVLSVTGFCVVSGARQVFLAPKRMLVATALLAAGYAAVAMLTGHFSLGVAGQPAAHGDHVWNVLALVLVGLTAAFAGGCPVRQLVMTGEGNGDAFTTTMGVLVGGALAHTLGLASSGAGTTNAGRVAVVIGIVVVVAYAAAITARHRADSTAS